MYTWCFCVLLTLTFPLTILPLALQLHAVVKLSYQNRGYNNIHIMFYNIFVMCLHNFLCGQLVLLNKKNYLFSNLRPYNHGLTKTLNTSVMGYLSLYSMITRFIRSKWQWYIFFSIICVVFSLGSGSWADKIPLR